MAGQPVSATKGIPFSRFAEFNNDVQQFVQGSDGKSVLRDVEVRVEDGSYKLLILLPLGLTSLLSDTQKIATEKSVAGVDRKRAEVVLRWQERAKSDPTFKFAIRPQDGQSLSLEISSTTTIKQEDKAIWIDVERYVVGQIVDLGGAHAANVHLRPRNQKEILIISADAAELEKHDKNLIYHDAIAHVKYKQNVRTKETDEYKLLSLRPYAKKADDSRLQELFKKGAAAWADVTNPGEWVDKLRGGADA